MGLVYVFMVAWVSGGVLLGSNLLLAQAVPEVRVEAPEELTSAATNGADGTQDRGSFALHVVALALIGFGLGGLITEGFGLWGRPWSSAVAFAGALVLGAIGWLTRGPHKA